MHKSVRTAAFVGRSFAPMTMQRPEPTPGRGLPEDRVAGYPLRARLFLPRLSAENSAEGGEVRERECIPDYARL